MYIAGLAVIGVVVLLLCFLAFMLIAHFFGPRDDD